MVKHFKPIPYERALYIKIIYIYRARSDPSMQNHFYI